MVRLSGSPVLVFASLDSRKQNTTKPQQNSCKQERNLNDGFHNLRHYENMFQLSRSVVYTAKHLMVEFEKAKKKPV
jgi:hypothetical protein